MDPGYDLLRLVYVWFIVTGLHGHALKSRWFSEMFHLLFLINS